MNKILGRRLGPCPVCGEELAQATLTAGVREGLPAYPGIRTFEPVPAWDELLLAPCGCRLKGDLARAAMVKIREYAKPKEVA